MRTLAMKSFPGLCGELLFTFALLWWGDAGEEGRSCSELGAVSLYRGQSFVAAVTGGRNGALNFVYCRCWERSVLRHSRLYIFIFPSQPAFMYDFSSLLSDTGDSSGHERVPPPCILCIIVCNGIILITPNDTCTGAHHEIFPEIISMNKVILRSA